MSSRHNALGRGLGALIPGAPPAAPPGPMPDEELASQIPLDRIDTNPEQLFRPDGHIEQAAIGRLARNP